MGPTPGRTAEGEPWSGSWRGGGRSAAPPDCGTRRRASRAVIARQETLKGSGVTVGATEDKRLLQQG